MYPIDDLVLSINRSSQGYVVSDRHGRSLSTFDDAQSHLLFSGRENGNEAIGRRLYELLFSSLKPAEPSKSLRRVIVKLIDADKLGQLSWEVLHNGSAFLSLSPSTAIIRLHSPPQQVINDFPITTSRMRMLITIVSDIPDEAEALRSIGMQLGIEVVILSEPTRGRIFTKMEEAAAHGQPFSLWHHIGSAQVRGGDLSLLLSRGDTLSIEQLNRALGKSGGIKVLTLNLSGEERGPTPFYPINVPLLLASSRTLDPVAARTGFNTFYTTVWQDGVAQAVNRARLAMSDVDFGTHDWAALLHFQTTQADRLIPDVQKGDGMTQRDQLFISYSHADKEWLEKLQPYLNALKLHFKIVIWDDRDLSAGQRWHDAIMNALNRSKVVLVLASVNYFASSYISQHELPIILAAAGSNEITFLWAAVSKYNYSITSLTKYQAVFDPKTPLDRQDPHGQQDALLAISDTILRAMNSTTPPSSTP